MKFCLIGKLSQGLLTYSHICVVHAISTAASQLIFLVLTSHGFPLLRPRIEELQQNDGIQLYVEFKLIFNSAKAEN
jgi:hypothetical protein